MRSKFWTLLIAVAMIAAPKSSSALLLKAIEEAYNVIPLSPVINFGEDIAETGKLLNKTAMKVQKLTLQIKKDIINLKMAVLDFKQNWEDGNWGAIFGLTDSSPNAGVGTFGAKAVKVCDMDMAEISHSELAQKLQTVLLTYGNGEKEIVDRNRRKFYLDNVYNIYSSVQLLKDMLSEDGDIGMQLAATKECLSEGHGENCDLPPLLDNNEENEGGNNEMLMYYGYALGTLENLIKTWESVAALKAQLRALETIINIELIQDEQEEVSSITPIIPEKIYASSSISNSQPVAFAQVVYNDNNSDNFDDIIEEENGFEDAGTERFSGASLNFAEPTSTVTSNPFNEKIKQSASHQELNETERLLSEAMSFHNLIKDIDDYAHNQTEYKKTSEQYRKKLQIVKDSNQCGLDYIRRYFTSDDTWSGKGLNDDITGIVTPSKEGSISEWNIKNTIVDYDNRLGISGWAIDAYELAKAGSVNNVNRDTFKDKDGKYVKEAKFEEKEKDSYDETQQVSGKGIDVSDADKAAQDTKDTSAYNLEQNENIEVKGEELDDDDLAISEDAEHKSYKGADLEQVEKKHDINETSSKQEEYDSGKGVSAETSKKTQDENRKATLIAWQIGDLASEDLSLNADNWGENTDNPMIWNDAKIFYDQYLDGKYENIKTYLLRYDVNDFKDIIISALQGQVLEIGNTDHQTKLNDLYQRVEAELDAVIALKEQDLATQIAPELKEERETLMAEIEALDNQLTKLNKRYGDSKSDSEDNAYTAKDQEASSKISYLIGMGDKKVSDSGVSLISSSSTQQKSNRAEDTKDLKSELATLSESEYNKANQKYINETGTNFERAIEKLKETIKDKQDKLDKVNADIEADKFKKQQEIDENTYAAFSQNIANIVKEFKKDKKKIDDDYKILVKAKVNQYLDTVRNTEGLEAKRTIEKAINDEATSQYNLLEKTIETIITNGKKELHDLGDKLYLPISSEQVTEIHKEIIDKLKALNITLSVATANISNMLAFADLELMDTNSEEEGFFVGSVARRRDFKAPHPMKDYSQPPVREIFHFDMTDFAGIKPYVGGDSIYEPSVRDKVKWQKRAITRGDFLEYGGKIPDLWKVMLSRNAFIESEFKLKPALNQGCEAVAFLRGGIMPCRVGDSNVVLDVHVKKDNNIWKYPYGDNDKYIRRYETSAEGLPKCLLIEMNGGTPHLSFYDADLKVDRHHDDPPMPDECRKNTSELGMILDADDDNNIAFKPFIYELFNENFNINDKGKKLNKKNKNILALSEQAQFSRNQIGDFLRQTESEKKMRLSLQEMKTKIESQQEHLKEVFKDNGFEEETAKKLSMLDLADTDNKKEGEDTPNVATIKANIRNIKDAKIEATEKAFKAAKDKLASGDTSKETSEEEAVTDSDENTTNKAVEETISKITKLITLLKNDKSELIEITMETADHEDDDIKEEIATAEADKKAVGKYKKHRKQKANDDENPYKDLEEAYCANY